MSSFDVEFLGHLCAIGLEDISLDLEGVKDKTPLVTMQTTQMVSHNGSSVNESPSVAVGKAISIGDPISRRKPHRPSGKQFLSFSEKGRTESGNKQQKNGPLTTQENVQDTSQGIEPFAAAKPKRK